MQNPVFRNLLLLTFLCCGVAVSCVSSSSSGDYFQTYSVVSAKQQPELYQKTRQLVEHLWDSMKKTTSVKGLVSLTVEKKVGNDVDSQKAKGALYVIGDTFFRIDLFTPIGSDAIKMLFTDRRFYLLDRIKNQHKCFNVGDRDSIEVAGLQVDRRSIFSFLKGRLMFSPFCKNNQEAQTVLYFPNEAVPPKHNYWHRTTCKDLRQLVTTTVLVENKNYRIKRIVQSIETLNHPKQEFTVSYRSDSPSLPSEIVLKWYGVQGVKKLVLTFKKIVLNEAMDIEQLKSGRVLNCNISKSGVVN